MAAAAGSIDLVEETVTIPAGPLDLGGVLAYPASGMPRSGVLVCPPHPHFAGTRDNNVVLAVARALAGSGFLSLRFDYRGVGDSSILLPPDETSYDWWEEVERTRNYEPAREDAAWARAHLHGVLETDESIHLVGYSFGAAVASLLACTPDDASPAGRLVGIAPPLRRFPLDFLSGSGVTSLFLLGGEDFLYCAAEREALDATLGTDGTISVLEGRDHFLRGCEEDVAARIIRFLEESPSCPS